MRIEEIEVTIDRQGRVIVAVRGVKGTACLTLTEALERALGGEILQRDMTAEAYEPFSTEVQDINHLEVGKPDL